MSKHVELKLTNQEFGHLAEAIRYSQEAHTENDERGRLNPVLSRIQRKLGLEPGVD